MREIPSDCEHGCSRRASSGRRNRSKGASAAASQKDIAFHSAFAVRQLETGLASVLSLLPGATVTLYGAALLDGLTYPKWVGGLAVVGGVPTSLSGVMMAFSGFSELEMAINMPASLMLVIWVMVLGVFLWRSVGQSRDRSTMLP